MRRRRPSVGPSRAWASLQSGQGLEQARQRPRPRDRRRGESMARSLARLRGNRLLEPLFEWEMTQSAPTEEVAIVAFPVRKVALRGYFLSTPAKIRKHGNYRFRVYGIGNFHVFSSFDSFDVFGKINYVPRALCIPDFGNAQNGHFGHFGHLIILFETMETVIFRSKPRWK